MKILSLYLLGFMTGILVFCSVMLSNPLYSNMFGKWIFYALTIGYAGFSIYIIKKNLEK